ncbi:hypothetical protein [Paenibacillus naphthalenovorans]|uniref:hypothetical protein n=1 Tax=Paenibacillus naphthalenovorans TaxID=162209 RepID=UPI00088DC6A4|nr:hypothetical protein [Paenibacillus naphthalenovorans]SDJ60519.1 hypothetical protein SAMN05421868_13413 [Paenibacillus naphthalenovorans]
MPIPDIAGLPPFAEFRDLETKLSELIQKYNNLLVSLDSLNVVSLTADHIDAGTLNAGIVTVRADYAGGAFIEISANGIRINDGVKDTFVADTAGFITLVGAVFRSALGYPRVELNSVQNLIAAYTDADTYIALIPNASGVPTLVMVDAGTTKGFMNRGSALTGTTLGTFDNEPLNLQPHGPLQIEGTNGISGNFRYVKDVVNGVNTYGTITVKKGIVTNIT